MMLHALLPVCDEAGIMGQCLEHMLQWSDSLYMFDTSGLESPEEAIAQRSVG